MLTDQFKSRVGTDLWDGIEVIAAKKDAEVNKLDRSVNGTGSEDKRSQE